MMRLPQSTRRPGWTFANTKNFMTARCGATGGDARSAAHEKILKSITNNFAVILGKTRKAISSRCAQVAMRQSTICATELRTLRCTDSHSESENEAVCASLD
jgi:hypothetical protein